jgi:predicted membrane protein (TIGR00267 family)
MMAEEHQLSPVDRKTAFKAAWVVGLSAIVGSLVPILPFMFLSVAVSMWMSVLVTALVLFGIGVYKARVTVGRPMRSGLEMMLIGTVSAMAGYLVGVLLKVPPLP